MEGKAKGKTNNNNKKNHTNRINEKSFTCFMIFKLDVMN